MFFSKCTFLSKRKRALSSSTFQNAALYFTISAFMAGCSVTTPIASLVPDDQLETGSIPHSQTLFVDKLNSEDWRRAKAAISVALDPQSTGTAVKWDNPESKTSGSFMAAGTFVVHNDLICRPFQAVLVMHNIQTHPKGFACRQGPNDWVIEQPAPIEGQKKLQPGELF
jgi:surface antigen